MATVSNYPTVSSVRWLKQVIKEPSFTASTSSHEFEDGGKSFNDAGGTVQEWEITYGGLTSTQWDILDAHFEEARLTNDFSFVDRLGVTQTGVRYKSFDVSFSKYYAQERKVVLCKYATA